MQLDDGRLSLGSPGLGPAVKVRNCFAAVPKNHSIPLPKKTKRPENHLLLKGKCKMVYPKSPGFFGYQASSGSW